MFIPQNFDDEFDVIVSYFVETRNYDSLIRVALHVYENSIVDVLLDGLVLWLASIMLGFLHSLH